MKHLCLRINSFLFWVFVEYAFPNEVTQHQFRRDHALDGYIPASGYLQKQSVASLIQCGRLCSGHKECAGFFYTSNTTICQLHQTEVNSEEINNLQNSSVDTVYYAKNESTDDVFFECPVNNGTWTRARLPDGSAYMFKLFTNNAVTHSKAVASCSASGGSLLKIINGNKMNFVLNNLTKCASVKDKSYWIDGTNIGADDLHAADAYKTADNETVPQTLEFWYPGMPDNPSVSNCIWISPVFSYRFDDVTCYYYSIDGVYYICEKKIN